MIYYYAPCFVGNPPGSTDPDTGDTYTPDIVKQPGKDIGGGPVFLSNLPAGMVVLKYDDPETRCVVRMATASGRPGWVYKTASEVLADYPGLPGVV